MRLEIPNAAPPDVATLHRWLLEAFRRAGDGFGIRVIRRQDVGTTETRIAHGLSGPPLAEYWSHDGVVRVGRSRASDDTFVYLQASVATRVDLVVIPNDGLITVGEALNPSDTPVDGSGAVNRLATWLDANTLTSNANGTFDGTDLAIANRLATSNPGTTLQTSLTPRVNVAGVQTSPRIMMGPAANVGSTLVFANFQGRNGAGAITVAQLDVGDVVKEILVVSPGGLTGSAKVDFEATITVNDQIQQSSASNLTAQTYWIVVERRSATGATTERPLYVVP